MKKMLFAVAILSFSGICLAETDAAKKDVVKKDVNTNVAANKVTVDKQLNICYIDASEVMMSTESGKKVEETRRELADNLGKKQQDLEKEAKAFEAKKTTMSKAAQEQTEDKLIKMKREYEKEMQVAQQKLNIVTQRTLADLETSTKELAEKGKYDVVYDVYSGRPIYVAREVMKTADLAQLMDKHAKDKKAEMTKVADNKKTAGSTKTA